MVNVSIVCKKTNILFSFKQDYSDFHHVEVMVTAHLRVDSTTKNTVLQNAVTQVIKAKITFLRW